MAGTVEAVFETAAEASGDIREALSTRRSVDEGENPSGETQLEADIYADEVLEERLLAIDGVASYASEEQQEVATADEVGGDGYHVTCDPLDGSSNLRSNNGMGTILGVYEERPPAPGDALVAAGYVLYGPITTMVTAVDGTVSEYLVESGTPELLEADLTVPEDPVVYGFGGRVPDWTDEFSAFVTDLEDDRLKLRYGGAMAADVNQVLTYGGIFGYPMLEGKPEGKLRLQFEGQPIAKVFADAGGASTDGNRSLLALEPSGIHDRAPVFVGSKSLVSDLEDALDG
jgi:fructose-1,6-bisphosphatase I